MVRRVCFVAGDDKKRLRTSLAASQVNWCYVAGHGLQCCRSTGATSQVNWCYVAGHGLQCGRSAFLGRTCDVVGLTAAISVASPQQKIRPATPERETCDARWGASITGVEDLRRHMGNQHYRSGRPATLYALQQRFPSPVSSKESDLRSRSGRPATPEGRGGPATLCVSPPSSHSPFLRSHSPPPSSLPAPASPSSPLPHPRKRFRNPAQYFNILTLVFWWQSIYICDI